MKRALILFLILICGNAIAANPAPLFPKNYSYNFNISTNNSLTQRYFTQAMVLFYGFEYAESIRSFRAARQLDPNCAICYWGESLALSLNNNSPTDGNELEEAIKAKDKALSKLQYAGAKESHLILALKSRYEVNEADEITINTLDYFEKMQTAYNSFPNSADLAALFALATFEYVDWEFASQFEYTQIAVNALKHVLKQNPNHYGANHYLIHLLEQTPQKKELIAPAKKLALAPNMSSHLLHMPAHVYMLMGKYHDASNANLKAINAFKTYEKQCKSQGFSPLTNYLNHHNHIYLIHTSIMEGRRALSLKTASDLNNIVTEELLEQNPDMETFLNYNMLTMLRFGKYNHVLAYPQISGGGALSQGLRAYARGFAFSNLKRDNEANLELNKLKQLIANGSINDDLSEEKFTFLKIAYTILQAEINLNHKEYADAIANYELAVKLDESLGFNEPPIWHFPIKQYLADAYYLAKDYKNAGAVYLQDLEEFPNNGYSLYGLYLCHKAAGNMEAAKNLLASYKQAFAYADINLTSRSRF